MTKAASSRGARTADGVDSKRRPATSRSARNESSGAGVRLRFTATLFQPKTSGKRASWSFLRLPPEVSKQLPSRGQSSVNGTLNGVSFQVTLEPDGEGGHWLKVDRKLSNAAGVQAGDVVTLDVVPAKQEPEPKVPADLRRGLADAPAKVRSAWTDITPAARRDFVHWIVSAKLPETRARRIRTACDMLAKGKRRPCCFDRSGMYSKSLACPAADDDSIALSKRSVSD